MTGTDVLVVGAGPAGAVAALVLARAGTRVRLVDRSEFPRDKLCGDTLNPGSLSILDRLGVGRAVRRRTLPISGMTVTGPAVSVAADYPDNLCGAAIARRDLDAVLLEAAVAAGAEFTPGVRVRGPLLSSDRRTVTGAYTSGATSIHVPARVVIAADGRHSSLAFALNLARFPTRPKRWAFGAYFSGVRGLTSRGEMHIRPDGYIGVAPLPNGLANVCVVGERRGGRRADRLRPDDVIARALDDPALRPRFEHARRVSSVSVLGPLAVEVRRAGCPGLLLAGDAAGFVDPMTGDGLRFALRGGELAALAALDELESGVPAFERLGRMRARDFARKYRMNRVLRSLVSSPRAIGLATRLAARWPAPVRVLVAVAGDTHLARKAGLHGPPGAE